MMPSMETYHGHVRTQLDAILLFEVCRLGLIPRIRRRLSERERLQIKSGSVYVWDEREAGLKRWTDGKSWSASRVSGSFLTYREMDGNKYESSNGNSSDTSGSSSSRKRKNSEAHGKRGSPDSEDDETNSNANDSNNNNSGGLRYKQNGLYKQSFSLTTSNNLKLHLISYYSKQDLSSSTSAPEPGKLLQPSMDERFKHIRIPLEMYPDTSNSGSNLVSAITTTPLYEVPPGYPGIMQQQQQRQQLSSPAMPSYYASLPGGGGGGTGTSVSSLQQLPPGYPPPPPMGYNQHPSQPYYPPLPSHAMPGPNSIPRQYHHPYGPPLPPPVQDTPDIQRNAGGSGGPIPLPVPVELPSNLRALLSVQSVDVKNSGRPRLPSPSWVKLSQPASDSTSSSISCSTEMTSPKDSMATPEVNDKPPSGGSSKISNATSPGSSPTMSSSSSSSNISREHGVPVGKGSLAEDRRAIWMLDRVFI